MKMPVPHSVYKFSVNLTKISTGYFGEVEGLIFKFIGRPPLWVARSNFYKHQCQGLPYQTSGLKWSVIKMAFYWHKVSQMKNFEIALLIFVSVWTCYKGEMVLHKWGDDGFYMNLLWNIYVYRKKESFPIWMQNSILDGLTIHLWRGL